MKYLLTVLASVVLALLATWYAIAARVKMLERPPEQVSVLVLPGPDGACLPRVARPVVWAHVDDAIEWRAVELPGCEGQGTFALDSSPGDSELFSPLLRGAQPARERTLKVTHAATAGVSVNYTVELPNGRKDTARVSFF